MISLLKDDIIFNYRIAGACIHNHKVLLHKSANDPFWSLPGGRAELLENSQETVVREILEETGFRSSIVRPLWFSEHFFTHNNRRQHEVGVIYQVMFEDREPLEKEVFYGEEPNGLVLTFRWFNLNELAELELYPTYLKEGLRSIPESLGHMIHYHGT